MAPSVIGGAVVPIAVYYLVRHHVGGDEPALAIAGVPAAAWVGFEWVRRRRLDPIGGVVLFGFVAGLITSAALGGDAFVLKVRDSAITCAFGVLCLLSLAVGSRPLMFHIGRAMSAGDDPVRRRAFDELWGAAPARALFRLLTVAWGVGLLCDAATRICIAAALPTAVFVVVSPAASAFYIGGLFLLTVRLSRSARRRGEAPAETGGIG